MSASTGNTVAMLVAVLVLLGLGMIALAVWLVRSTRSDPQALGPLEVMGDRRFRKGAADRRQANLDTARPPGAATPAPMVPFESGDGDGDGDGVEAGIEETPPARSPENSDASMPDPVVSGQSSDEAPADVEASADADKVDKVDKAE